MTEAWIQCVLCRDRLLEDPSTYLQADFGIHDTRYLCKKCFMQITWLCHHDPVILALLQNAVLDLRILHILKEHVSPHQDVTSREELN